MIGGTTGAKWWSTMCHYLRLHMDMHIHSPCPILDSICNLDQPFCAQNTRAQYMALKQINGCSLIRFNNISPTRSTASTQIYNITSRSSDNDSVAIAYPTVSRERVGCDQSRSHICAAGIVTGLILILISLMAIVLCFFFIHKNRRHQGTINF